MGEIEDWVHWLLLFLILGGFFMLLTKDNNKTAKLFGVFTDTYGAISTDIKQFAS